MNRLQVFINNKWEYVFCRNELKSFPVITDDKLKAVRGDEYSLQYFESNFGNLKFKISKWKICFIKTERELLKMISNDRKLEILEENGRISWETYIYLNHFNTRTCGVDGLKELINICDKNNIDFYGVSSFSNGKEINEMTRLYGVDERKVIYLGSYYGDSLFDEYGDESIIDDDRIYLIVK